MTNESNNDAGKQRVREPGAAPEPKIHAELVAIRAELTSLREMVAAAAGSAAAAEIYMRVLLPEQYLALKPAEVLALHHEAPAARLKLTADFNTNMVSMPRGTVIDAGDPRVALYADRLQVALLVGGEQAAERVAELVAAANQQAVKATLNERRRQQQREAEDLAARAAEAAKRAQRLAREV